MWLLYYFSIFGSDFQKISIVSFLFRKFESYIYSAKTFETEILC